MSNLKSGSRKSKSTSSARRVTLSKPVFPRAAPQSERDEVTARIVADALKKGTTPSITMRGTLKFTFPAHASLEVRTRIVAGFVREAQARIDAEEERNGQMAAVRKAIRGSGVKLEQCAFTFEETAEQLGISVEQVEKAVALHFLLASTIGYVRHVTASEIRRFKDRVGTIELVAPWLAPKQRYTAAEEFAHHMRKSMPLKRGEVAGNRIKAA